MIHEIATVQTTGCFHINHPGYKVIIDTSHNALHVVFHTSILHLYQIKRRLPQKDSSGNSPPLSFSDEIRRELNESMQTMSQLTRTLQILSKSALQQAAIMSGRHNHGSQLHHSVIGITGSM